MFQNPFYRRTLRLGPLARTVRSRANKIRACSDAQLRQRADEFRAKSIPTRAVAEKRGTLDSLSQSALIQTLPLVSEAVRRTFGFELHPCQILGAASTALGGMIEMHTGEGKTVVTGAAAMIRAINGFSVHVATTNDYLAARDFESLQPAFEVLGIHGSLLPTKMQAEISRLAYDAQITYGPGYQFGFDFLFDQITLRKHNPASLGRSTVQTLDGFDLAQQLVQCRPLDVCIVDEADSVLVDEATTPLILSFDSDQPVSTRPFKLALKIARDLTLNQDFRVDKKRNAIVLEKTGKQAIRTFRQRYEMNLERSWESYVRSALYADHCLTKNEHYVVQNDEINIVDQNTGRIFDDRTWQAGLHQAVEVKEGVPVKPPRVSKARITRQRFIGFYKSLCGLSGTAIGARRDFAEFYRVDVVPIPTHLPSRRTVFRPRFFADQASKFDAIVNEVRTRHQTGQPILIGTRTIQESELLYQSMASVGLTPVLLNGVQDQAEADIIAVAGDAGAITIATNMAGRGTDIRLTEPSRLAGGLHVIGVSPNQSARIDRQLVGRSARQGEPGSAQFFLAADDDLIANHGPALANRIVARSRRDGEAKIDGGADVAAIQNLCDTQQFARRQKMLMQDRWMDSVRDAIYGETASA